MVMLLCNIPNIPTPPPIHVSMGVLSGCLDADPTCQNGWWKKIQANHRKDVE